LEELIQQDLKYRDKQLMRLKDEVLDLEDFNESVALNEFTLDDFRMDLSNYVEVNRTRLQDAPLWPVWRGAQYEQRRSTPPSSQASSTACASSTSKPKGLKR
jgi:hypothetical protein